MKPVIAVPATGALVYRAWSRKSLTPVGIVTAFLTAVAHAVHPWSVFFALLGVFFLAGTAVTKVFQYFFCIIYFLVIDRKHRSNMTLKRSLHSPQPAQPEAKDLETTYKSWPTRWWLRF